MNELIPTYLGVPATILTVMIGFVKFLFFEGMSLTPSNLMTVGVSILSAIYLYTKVRGQHLENVKKKLRSAT